ncbi:MAG: DUF3240 family protein [Thauera sp.]|nr:DUF3240 family protein [Thauera sp.]
MSAPDTCLNLIMPSALADDVVDLLLGHRELAISFASFPVNAHGADVALVEPSEHVSGQASRIQIQLLLRREDAETVLGYLKAQLPNPKVFYWATPILLEGRLG